MGYFYSNQPPLEESLGCTAPPKRRTIFCGTLSLFIERFNKRVSPCIALKKKERVHLLKRMNILHIHLIINLTIRSKSSSGEFAII